MSKEKITVKDIHPEGIIEKFDELMLGDIDNLLCDQEHFVDTPCPACKSLSVKPAFTYQRLSYKRCDICDTLYISPAPTEERHLQFLSDSKAMAFWRNSLPPSMTESRIPMYEERVEFAINTFDRLSIKPKTILEVGAGNGEFVNHYLKADPFVRFILLEPQELNINSDRVTIIQDGFDAALRQNVQVDAVIAWELIEHIIEPHKFLQTLSSVLRVGAPFIFATPNERSLETRLLSTNSSNILFDHVRLYNPNSIKLLLEKNGFLLNSLSTPGKLDAERISTYLKENSTLSSFGAFFELLLDESSIAQFQSYIVDNLLSSHMRCVAIKN